MKDVIEFALQMERDGKAYYERLATQASSSSIREIFQTLAEEEDKHFRVFAKIREGLFVEAGRELDAAQERMKTVRNVFVQLTENCAPTSPGPDVRAAWEQALRAEEQSENLYREEAARTNDAARRTLFEKIADEEKSHRSLIDNMISFAVDPQSFVDSADFMHFKSWEGH